MPRKNPETSPKESHRFSAWFETLALRTLLNVLNVEIEVIVNGEMPAEGRALFLLFPHMYQPDMPTAVVGLAQAGRRKPIPVVNGEFWMNREPHRTLIKTLHPAGVLAAPSKAERERRKQNQEQKEQVSRQSNSGILERLRSTLGYEKAGSKPNEGTVKRMLDAGIHVPDLSLVMFPGGTRLLEAVPAQNDSGGFVFASELWLPYGIDTAVYAVHIQNALPLFGKKQDGGEITRSAVMHELRSAIGRKLTGKKHISTVVVEPLGKVSELKTAKTNDPIRMANELKELYERYEVFALSGRVEEKITEAEVRALHSYE